MSSSNTCIVIAGPTAVGKTSLAIELAQHYGTEIISADSRQCYRELNIGVAKPTQQELSTVPHHFINHLSITEEFSAADYETYSLKRISEIFLNNKVAVVCGGTGLYIKALTSGLDKIPEVSSDIRIAIREKARKEGMQWAQEILAKEDVPFAASESFYNTNRVLRALEVFQTTGKPISYFQNANSTKRGFNIIQICLDLPREVLYERINSRVDKMMQVGLLDEVKSLLPFRNLNALNTVGYKEIFSYLDKEITMDKAVDLIKQHTRQYAKRQKTWFTKQDNMLFCEPDLSKLLSIIENKLS